jgi:hypothetical protein
MCYERSFFDHLTAKRAQREQDRAKTAERSLPTKAEPMRPAPESKKPKEVERETELV